VQVAVAADAAPQDGARLQLDQAARRSSSRALGFAFGDGAKGRASTVVVTVEMA
jgi:hypothetical protein